MHILVVVSSTDPKDGTFTEATRCLTIFVAVDDARRPVPVPPWQPTTDEDKYLQEGAIRRIKVRRDIEAAMKLQTYSDAGTAPETMLRFLAALSQAQCQRQSVPLHRGPRMSRGP